MGIENEQQEVARKLGASKQLPASQELKSYVFLLDFGPFETLQKIALQGTVAVVMLSWP